MASSSEMVVKRYQAKPLNLDEFDPSRLSLDRGIPLVIPSHNFGHSKLKGAFLINNGVYYEAFQYIGFLPNMWVDSAGVWRATIPTQQNLSYGRRGLMRKITEKGEFALMLLATDFKDIHSGTHEVFSKIKDPKERKHKEVWDLVQICNKSKKLHQQIKDKNIYNTSKHIYFYMFGEKELGYILKDMKSHQWNISLLCSKILENYMKPRDEISNSGVFRLCQILNGCCRTVVDSRLVCFRIATVLKTLKNFIAPTCYDSDMEAIKRVFAVDVGYQITNEILTTIEDAMPRWNPEIKKMVDPDDIKSAVERGLEKSGVDKSVAEKSVIEKTVTTDTTTIVEPIVNETEVSSDLHPTSEEFVPQSYFNLASQDSIVIKSKNTKVTIKAVGKEIPEELRNVPEHVPTECYVPVQITTQDTEVQTEHIDDNYRMRALEIKLDYWRKKSEEYLTTIVTLQMKLDEFESKQ